MKEFDRLVKIIAKLRGKKGCPWDRVQTHKTLKPYIIEEAYETLNAIDEKDENKLKDELGDLLLQVMLHAQIAKEERSFEIKDVINGIGEKMVRRHPHVFQKRKVSGVDQVWQNWEEIKKGEAEYRSVLDSIPKAMPALYRADKTQKKAARTGFDWDNVAGAWDKVNEELGEIKELLDKKEKNASRITEEIGDLLFAVVNVARKLGINSEEALHDAVLKFSKRFMHIENSAKNRKIPLRKMTLAQMDVLWEDAKKRIKKV